MGSERRPLTVEVVCPKRHNSPSVRHTVDICQTCGECHTKPAGTFEAMVVPGSYEAHLLVYARQALAAHSADEKDRERAHIFATVSAEMVLMHHDHAARSRRPSGE